MTFPGATMSVIHTAMSHSPQTSHRVTVPGSASTTIHCCGARIVCHCPCFRFQNIVYLYCMSLPIVLHDFSFCHGAPSKICVTMARSDKRVTWCWIKETVSMFSITVCGWHSCWLSFILNHRLLQKMFCMDSQSCWIKKAAFSKMVVKQRKCVIVLDS